MGKSIEMNPRNRKNNLSKMQAESEEDLSDIKYQLR